MLQFKTKQIENGMNIQTSENLKELIFPSWQSLINSYETASITSTYVARTLQNSFPIRIEPLKNTLLLDYPIRVDIFKDSEQNIDFKNTKNQLPKKNRSQYNSIFTIKKPSFFLNRIKSTHKLQRPSKVRQNILQLLHASFPPGRKKKVQILAKSSHFQRS